MRRAKTAIEKAFDVDLRGSCSACGGTHFGTGRTCVYRRNICDDHSWTGGGRCPRCVSNERVRHPLWWCSTCERSTQRRDGSSNCYWCGQAYGEEPEPPDPEPETFETWWAGYEPSLNTDERFEDVARAAWEAATAL